MASGVQKFLGLTLLLAAILKAQALLSSRDPASLPLAPFWIACLVQAELGLGLWMFFANGYTRFRSQCALVCFLTFGAFASKEAFDGQTSCGCFGSIQIRPIFSAVFDVAAAATLWVSCPPRNEAASPFSQTRMRVGASALMFASAALWTGFYLRRTDPAHRLALDAAAWTGKPFPYFDQIPDDLPLRAGRWLLVFYHYDCDACLAAIPAYEALASNCGSTRVAFVAIPPIAPNNFDPVKPSTNYLRLALGTQHEWLGTAPIVATIQNGIVISAEQGNAAVLPAAVGTGH